MGFKYRDNRVQIFIYSRLPTHPSMREYVAVYLNNKKTNGIPYCRHSVLQNEDFKNDFLYLEISLIKLYFILSCILQRNTLRMHGSCNPGVRCNFQ